MKNNRIIYLDNSATTPVDPDVVDFMLPFFSEKFANASSLHKPGLDNRVAVDRSQAQLAEFLGCDKSEVYFTSGATESNNMVIFGVFKAMIQFGMMIDDIHIITSEIEHDAVLEPIRELEKAGVAVTYLPVNRDGLVEVAEFKKAVQSNTMLVSIMYVNNEIGTIQPIKEIGDIIGVLNKERKQKIYFHTDATQAPSYCDCEVNELGVDFLSLSAHKIYGPKGVGALYIKKGAPIVPLCFGGHQQDGIRPGTYNVPAIVGFGKAIEIISNQDYRKRENVRLKDMRNKLIDGVLKNIKGSKLNGSKESRTPNNANFIIPGVEGESLILSLSEKGIAVSTGSACSSHSLKSSHVLSALGIKAEDSHGSLRVTIGRFNKDDDIDYFLEILPEMVERLRKISPIKTV